MLKIVKIYKKLFNNTDKQLVMELREFIKETLVQIVEGVGYAQLETSKTGAYIVPYGIKTDNKTEGYVEGSDIGISKYYIPVYHVDFEVALTHSDGKEGKGGIGVWFGNAGIGGQIKTDGKDVSATNVKFRVPIIYTVSKVKAFGHVL